MARLQILELPEGAGDDRPPFVLVVDECAPQRYVIGLDASWQDHWQVLADKIGARGVIVTPDTIDIPANDTATLVVDEAFKTETQGWAAATNETLARIIDAMSGQTKRRPATEGLSLAHERTDIARDMDRLANHKAAMTDALGMDRTRDWDDIRNAARGIRKQRDSMRDAIQRVRNLHRPVEHRGQTICWECSAYDGTGSTDNSPAAYDQCSTNHALAADEAADGCPVAEPGCNGECGMVITARADKVAEEAERTRGADG